MKRAVVSVSDPSSRGRLDEVGGQVDAMVKGLMRAKSMSATMAEPLQLAFESALALGGLWALDQLWRELGFDALASVFRKAGYTAQIEHGILVMVFNRLFVAPFGRSRLDAGVL